MAEERFRAGFSESQLLSQSVGGTRPSAGPFWGSQAAKRVTDRGDLSLQLSFEHLETQEAEWL